jgi:hypothetical protein
MQILVMSAGNSFAAEPQEACHPPQLSTGSLTSPIDSSHLVLGKGQYKRGKGVCEAEGLS